MKKLYSFWLLLIPIIAYAQPPLTMQNVHTYLWANYQQFKGDPNTHAWYEQLLATNAPVHVYKGYVNYLYDSGNFKQIVALLPKLETAFAQDADIQLIFARALEKVGAQAQADEKVIKLNNQFKTHQEIAFQAANVYVRRKEPENALRAIDDLLNNSPRRPNNFLFHFLKAQIYVQLNNPTEALKSVRASLDMYPHFDKGWLLLAILEEQQGKLEGAIKGYTQFLELSGGNNQEVEQHLLQLVFKQKIAHQQTKAATIGQTCFQKALALFDRKDYQQALTQINQCLEHKPTDPESRLLKIQILDALHNQGAAANELRAWILQDPDNNEWYKTLFLLCRTGLNYQKAIAVLQDVVKEKPDKLMPLLYLADLSVRAHALDSALAYHKKALEMAQDPHLKTKLLFNMALVYYDQKKFKEMEKVLEQGRELNTNFTPLLNLLAYHYATHGKALEKARQLLDTVVRAEGNNPHYLDTQALVLYKLKQYDKAITVLQSAAEKAQNDATILRHLGKVYYKVGKKQEAIKSLEQALKVAHRDDDRTKCTNLLKRWRSNPSTH